MERHTAQEQKPNPASEEVKSLSGQLDQLRQSLADAEKAQLLGELSALRQQFGSLSQRLAEGDKIKSEYDIMSQFLSAVDRRMATLETIARAYLEKVPPPLPAQDKEAIKEGITAEVGGMRELDLLYNDLFGSKVEGAPSSQPQVSYE